MSLLVFALPGNDSFASDLARRLEGELGPLTLRRFPDGETYVRIDTPVRDRDLVLACTLQRPDDKLLPLIFLAATARELGAARVGLVAPYLAYMRQDRRFREGEGVTSVHFARLLSAAVDWIVTVDPHLHRRSSLGEIYSVAADVVHAAPHISAWIRGNVQQPLLIGPDAESAQWVQGVAEAANAPWIVLEKVRRGDRDVTVSVPNVERWRDHTPVLVDDIISTARTMIATIGHLSRAGLRAPVCIGVHAVFAERAYDELRTAGAAVVVTCNTIPHPSNAIDLHDALAGGVRRLTTLRPPREPERTAPSYTR
ncbi:MAG: ribose-phosphate pyrophosphokinase [Gemmatimonadota bacterium]